MHLILWPQRTVDKLSEIIYRFPLRAKLVIHALRLIAPPNRAASSTIHSLPENNTI